MFIHKAIAILRAHGLDVRPSDMPGLFLISGFPELTTNQVIDLARQKGPPQ